MFSFFSGGSGGLVKFSGLSARNSSTGVLLPNGLQHIPDFIATKYDTDGYLTSPTTIIVPFTGYYHVLFGFVSDSVFVGKWELLLSIGTQSNTFTQGATIASELAEGQVSNEDKLAAGAGIVASITQTSDTDQLVYPYIRVAYLGS